MLRRVGSLALATFVMVGCSLDVANPNGSSLQNLTGSQIELLLGGGYGQWYHSLTDASTAIPVDVMSDHFVEALGGRALTLLQSEPRLYGLTNAPDDPTFGAMIEEPWYNNYAALTAGNLVVKALANGAAIPGPTDSSANRMMLAAARFLQGAALSDIALDFDSGYAFDETYDPTDSGLPLVGRDSVRRAALVKLDAAIGLASATAAAWRIPESFLNQPGEAWSNTQLAQVASTWAARTIAYFPHDASENGAADWARVAAYASKGISSGAPLDMEIVGDSGSWASDYIGLSGLFYAGMSGAMANARVVCLFDAAYLCHHPNTTADRPVPRTNDYRFNGDDVPGDNCVAPDVVAMLLQIDPQDRDMAPCSAGFGGADFVYVRLAYGGGTRVPAPTGFPFLNNVGSVRYFGSDAETANYGAVGKLPFVLAAENDLLWAEGLLRSGGSPAAAAARINPSRVGRGHLPALTGSESVQQLLAAVAYERAIELYGADPMVVWYDARRGGPDLNVQYSRAVGDSGQSGWLPFGQGLQAGTPRLLPVPAKELSLIGHSIYTYGGPNPEPGAPAARAIFGATRDGRAILGPGRWAAIADSLVRANRRLQARLRR